MGYLRIGRQGELDLLQTQAVQLKNCQVQLIYELCEVQLEDPARFRGLLKSEEEATSWVSLRSSHQSNGFADQTQRVDPAGWDKQGNTYFLFDGE